MPKKNDQHAEDIAQKKAVERIADGADGRIDGLIHRTVTMDKLYNIAQQELNNPAGDFGKAFNAQVRYHQIGDNRNAVQIAQNSASIEENVKAAHDAAKNTIGFVPHIKIAEPGAPDFFSRRADDPNDKGTRGRK